MAISQKDIKGWEIVLGEKSERRHARQRLLTKSSSIKLRRSIDNLELREGDSISFNINTKNEYKVIGYGLIKDISFAIDQYIEIRILWFVKYSNKFDEFLPCLDNNEKYSQNDLFLTPFLDSIKFDQICDKIKILNYNDFKNLNNDDGNNNILKNKFICRRFTNDSSTYFTDLIDWDTMIESFNNNKDEFYETLKMLTLKPKNDKRLNSSKTKKVLEIESDSDPDLKSKSKPKSNNSSPVKKNKKSIKKIILQDDDDDDEYYGNIDDNDYNDVIEIEDERSDDNDDLDSFIVNDLDDEEYYNSKKKRKHKQDTKIPKKRKYKTKSAVSLPLIDNNFELFNDENYSTKKMLSKAKKALGTNTELQALPCREEEFYELYHKLEDSILTQNGCCIYVSGTPGVGKTATIREVIKQLSAKMTIKSNGIKMFNYLEINGLKLIKPQSAYEILWKKISGISTSTNNALNFLQQYFEKTETGDNDNENDMSSKLPLVVLLDELDQIVTKNQAVMYNFFNWPTYENSKLIVIAVANTMDLPERLLTNKISSRLGLSRIQFTSYSYNQLSEIIKHRLEQLSKQNDKLLIAKDAIEFASRKVASVSGDARRSLMICIRAIEIAESEFLLKSEIEKKELDNKFLVTIMHIMKAVNEISSSPIIGYLNSLPFLSKLVLASIMLRKKRSGIAEIQVGEIYDELSNQIQVLLFSDLKNKLKSEDLELIDIIFGSNNFNNCRSQSIINSSLFILKDLEESGILIMQPLKMERNRLIRLNISDDEILNCFKKDAMLKEIITFI